MYNTSITSVWFLKLYAYEYHLVYTIDAVRQVENIFVI
jgi:hypothetical protein